MTKSSPSHRAKDTPSCLYSRAIQLVSHKWAPYIVYQLEKGRVHYGDLKRRLDGISKKMLTQTLRQLERDGLVHRSVTSSNPPMVYYSLTPLGETLIFPLKQLRKWSQNHYASVEKARERYDQATAHEDRRKLKES